MVNRSIIKEMSRDDLLDDLLLDLSSKILGANILRVLGRNDNGIDTERDGSTIVLLVLDGNLGLRIWTEPRKQSGTTSSSHRSVQLVCEDDSERHELLSLIGGIAEHDTLITGTDVLQRTMIQTLSNIWRLLLNRDKNVAGLVVETLGRVIVTDVLDGVTDDLLVIDVGLGGDLAENHDHAGLSCSLASNLGVWVLSQASIEL